LREIGSGGGGVVYLGRHMRLDKQVVLKADRRKLNAKPETLRREVDALKNLSHTYIPQVYDFISDGETVYTVMDFIEGESFDRLLKHGERFAQSSVAEWARQLLEALCYLHGRPPHGILHSDIKPANVMLTPQGDIRLIDFNIALALGESGAVAVGRSHGYASPEHYSADFLSGSNTGQSAGPAPCAATDLPETEKMEDGDKTAPDPRLAETEVLSAQASAAPAGVFPSSGSSGTTGRKTVVLDVRSDIYGLGATLYHLLTGVRPARNAADVKPLTYGEYSPRIADIINKAMSPDPDLRYQSAEAMLADFRRLHEDDPRTKRQKRGTLRAAVLLTAAFLISGLASFTGLGQTERLQAAYASAEYAADALDAGDVPSALRLALGALPDKTGIFAPPRPARAQETLAAALGVYDLSDGYRPFRTLELPSPPFRIAISENGGMAAAVCADGIAVFRTDTAETVAKLPPAKSALAGAEFIGDSLLVYAGENGLCAYDTAGLKPLWTGRPATEIAVSADGRTVAAVYRDEGFATVYGVADGTEKAVVKFDGRKQRVTVNDTFANPNDNLLALSGDGGMLAVSFDDGSLSVFGLSDGNKLMDLTDASEFTHFEGGFSGGFFAFSATGVSDSVFAAVDMREAVQTGGFRSDGYFGVLAGEDGVFVSSDNIVVRIDPETGEQREIAYTEGDVTGFAHDARHTVVATGDGSFAVYDPEEGEISKYNTGAPCDFVRIAGDFALAGGRDTPVLRMVKLESRADARVLVYDASYGHDEARVNADATRAMLFSYYGFRLYDMAGRLLAETEIPDAALVYDQQYGKKSGNLSVLYKDALRIYSGLDGALIFEETGLASTFFAPYGISVFGRDGRLRLIDADTGGVLSEGEAEGEFAAHCGMTVDGAFLAGRELLGAAETGDGFLFAAGDGKTGAVYDDKGRELFGFTMEGKGEAFFTSDALIVSPEHGTPAAYRLGSGKKISDLEKDAYLAYVTETDRGTVSEYVSADGGRFGVLLDAGYGAVARLPGITDVTGDRLLFDYGKGSLREGRIYSIYELIDMAKGL
jgi:serine/threonine protein kinase